MSAPTAMASAWCSAAAATLDAAAKLLDVGEVVGGAERIATASRSLERALDELEQLLGVDELEQRRRTRGAAS